ncbi:MAG: glycosyl hydrolase family 79 C-terminal domain-containing protein [Ktedonobacterales bacterium]
MPKSHPRLFASLLIFCLLACACSPISVTPTNLPTATATTDPATVAIAAGANTAPIPSYFVGFSIEPQTLCQFLTLEQSSPALDRFYQNLGPSIIRFGGTSMDSSSWQPDAACSGLTFGRSTLADVFAFAQRVHARVIWGLNLKANDPYIAADEANAALYAGSDQLLGLEMGNEPNDWTTESAYEQAWQSYASAIAAYNLAPGLVGPSMYDGEGHNWFARYVQRERSLLTFVTYHYYPLQQGAHADNGQDATIPNLLNPALMARTAADLDRVVTVAHANHLALVIDETNSVNGGGAVGVSDTFASALWVADYLFTAAEHGVLAVNIHGSGGATGGPSYSPIVADPTTHQLTARPLYYGMLLFHLATGEGQSAPLQTTVTSSANLAAHAVLDRDGTLRVALINKDVGANVRVRVILNTSGAVYSSGHAMQLLAPSVTSTTGVTLGGASVGANGNWSSAEQQSVAVTDSSFTITVAAASAVLVTLSPHG